MADFKEKIVCITGVLPVPRRVAAEMIVANGGIFASRVTRQTDILVVGVFPRGRTTTNKFSTDLKYIDAGFPIVMASPEEFLASIKS